jgi:hypothetical protein
LSVSAWSSPTKWSSIALSVGANSASSTKSSTGALSFGALSWSTKSSTGALPFGASSSLTGTKSLTRLQVELWAVGRGMAYFVGNRVGHFVVTVGVLVVQDLALLWLHWDLALDVSWEKGDRLGVFVGAGVGVFVITGAGSTVGTLGVSVGRVVGNWVGNRLGLFVGTRAGLLMGAKVGSTVGTLGGSVRRVVRNKVATSFEEGQLVGAGTGGMGAFVLNTFRLQ